MSDYAYEMELIVTLDGPAGVRIPLLYQSANASDPRFTLTLENFRADMKDIAGELMRDGFGSKGRFYPPHRIYEIEEGAEIVTKVVK